MSSEKHPVVELTNAVKLYNINRESYNSEELQNLREVISISLFLSSDFYSEVRADAEAADYLRKQKVAEESERLRGQKHPDTLRRYNQKEVDNLARMNTKEFEDAVVEQNKRYYKIRLMIDSSVHILHSISSRLNMVSKN